MPPLLNPDVQVATRARGLASLLFHNRKTATGPPHPRPRAASQTPLLRLPERSRGLGTAPPTRTGPSGTAGPAARPRSPLNLGTSVSWPSTSDDPAVSSQCLELQTTELLSLGMPAPSAPPTGLPGRSEPDAEVVVSLSRSPSVSNATLPPVAAQRGSTSLGGRTRSEAPVPPGEENRAGPEDSPTPPPA